MIWDACDGSRQIGPIAGRLFRMVESQEQMATLGYVDTLEEHALLEELLDDAKPPCPGDWSEYHYLLKSPFRYPPLRWGSRFGKQHEPGIFYGGVDLNSALAESAYYRWIFWFSIDAAPVKGKMRTEHVLFSVRYETLRGIRLQNPPFAKYESKLTHRRHYAPTQAVGSAMRGANVGAFEYVSARDPERGICVGVFSPDVFVDRSPDESNPWWCEVSATEVAFSRVRSKSVTKFRIDDFLMDGRLPMPA